MIQSWSPLHCLTQVWRYAIANAAKALIVLVENGGVLLG